MQRILSLLIVVAFVNVACQRKTLQFVQFESERVSVSDDINPSKSIESVIDPYRDSLSQITERVIGYSSQTMFTGKPESLLTNFVSDLLLYDASLYLPVDFNYNISFSVMNVYGLRSSIVEGVVRVGDIFKVMPFENTVSVVGLRGRDMIELIQGFAKVGGEGVAGISFGISDTLAVGMKIGGKAIEVDKIYYGIVSDYLANGGGGMEAMKKSVCRKDLEVLLRDAIIYHIEKQKGENKTISSQLDKRVYVSK